MVRDLQIITFPVVKFSPVPSFIHLQLSVNLSRVTNYTVCFSAWPQWFLFAIMSRADLGHIQLSSGDGAVFEAVKLS
jgi:hypothetical protein